MRAVVDAPKAARVDVAVDLRRRERRVPEQLLDDAEVGAALEEVRRERVPQAVRVAEEAAHGARVEPASADREEEGVVRAARERRAARLQVARDVERGLLAQRHDAFLAALSSYVYELAVEIDVSEVEPDRLGASQPGRVEELEERAVAERERRVPFDDSSIASISAGFGASGSRRERLGESEASGTAAGPNV